MFKLLRPAFAVLILLTLVTGVAYPLAVTGIAQVVMPQQANGSVIRRGEAVVGSALIGQNFASERYFWPRPSATSPDPYNAAASSGSNLGTTSAKLKDRVAADIERLKTVGLTGAVPADAVTTSGSGLDPHISPDFAQAQVNRVATARQLSVPQVQDLLLKHTQNAVLGIVGEPRVNVLELNLALDALKS
ncbi:K+-transporting ATPase ATPase C chain [Rhizobium skierniewicense]|uniref:Potassium-transporting ATPase KdpC subunit n=1 Tax=Rhizobium skierniewicense TaxID=984260 RepID=A0A7W6C541_9HYPH|nr:potassium-transporting ATPase subunit KdpC [Rhizobium skierniewicense]MBB3944143.1 K+-transporting ATPase ATPase C chain [Rhizobium skierniewicense]